MILKKNEFEFWASEEITTPGISTKGIPPRMYVYITSITVRNDVPLDNSTAWELYFNTAYAPKLPDSTASVDVWGGDFTETISSNTSARKHDENLFLVRYDLRSKAYNISFADSSITTMRSNFYKFVDAYKAAGGAPGALITYRDERWTIGETAKFLYGGGNFERLQKDLDEMDLSTLWSLSKSIAKEDTKFTVGSTSKYCQWIVPLPSQRNPNLVPRH